MRRSPPPVGTVPAQGGLLPFGEQFERRVQPSIARATPRHIGKRYCKGGAVLAQLLRRVLRPSAYQHRAPVHRAVAHSRIKDAFGLRVFLPRPEGQGLPRIPVIRSSRGKPIRDRREEASRPEIHVRSIGCPRRRFSAHNVSKPAAQRRRSSSRGRKIHAVEPSRAREHAS